MTAGLLCVRSAQERVSLFFFHLYSLIHSATFTILTLLKSLIIQAIFVNFFCDSLSWISLEAFNFYKT